MSKKMVLLSLLVSTTVLTTSIKAEGLTVTNSSDVTTTQDVEGLTSSDESMNVFMEEPQTETSTSATDMSNSDTTISSYVSEAIVDTVGETTPTETEVTATALEPINEPIMDTVSATNSVPEVVPIAEPINEMVNVQSTEAKPVGTLKALQVLPETSSTSSKSPIIIGVMTLLFGLIGLLHMYAKRIFG